MRGVAQVLKAGKLDAPFPIQRQAMPAIMAGRDIIAIASTGSGKTIAYLLPMVRHCLDQQRLQAGEGPIGLVLVPTRELTMQVQCSPRCSVAAQNAAAHCALQSHAGSLLHTVLNTACRCPPSAVLTLSLLLC